MRSFTDMRFLVPIVQRNAAKSHTLGVSSCSLPSLSHAHTYKIYMSALTYALLGKATNFINLTHTDLKILAAFE